jgi:hypothetical protein
MLRCGHARRRRGVVCSAGAVEFLRVTQKPAAGYSGKSLAVKLGIREGMRVALQDAPRNYRSLVAPLPPAVSLRSAPASAQVVHWFVERRSVLEARVANLAAALRDEAALWISWPKRSSGRETDLTEDVLREVVLPYGLVDVKVCAFDATWSCLKFVRRLQHRR